MDTQLLIGNLTNPTLLFFVLGMVAATLKSDLEIPPSSSKFISLYLLFSIGFKGGQELAHSHWEAEIGWSLVFALLLAAIIPIYSFFILKTKLSISDSAAIASSYGSVSAVTFVAAIAFLEMQQLHYSGHMVAVMALMEAPAIIVGVMLLKFYSPEKGKTLDVASAQESIQDNTAANSLITQELNSNDRVNSKNTPNGMGGIIKHSLINGSVLLIVGSLIIGLVADSKQAEGIKPFTTDIFKGFLAIFLLDMGMVTAKRFKSFLKYGGFVTLFALLIPALNGCITAYLSQWITLDMGNRFVFAVLAASASYIAVPAAMKIAAPKADPGLYVPMALGVTFPFNITLGMPLYFWLVQM